MAKILRLFLITIYRESHPNLGSRSSLLESGIRKSVNRPQLTEIPLYPIRSAFDRASLDLFLITQSARCFIVYFITKIIHNGGRGTMSISKTYVHLNSARLLSQVHSTYTSSQKV
jgi:hypothetical protein